MFRQFLMLRLSAKNGERAFLMRNGRFERVLGPGRHRLFDPVRGLAVELHNAVRARCPAERSAVLKAARPDLAPEMFEPVDTKADEVAIVSLTGRPSFLMAPYQTRAFCKIVTCVRSRRSLRKREGRGAIRGPRCRRHAPGTLPGGRKSTSCTAERRTTSSGSPRLCSWSNSARSLRAGVTQNSARAGVVPRL
jgi:hypothetical protein